MPLPLAQLLLPRAFLSASGGFLQVAAAAACGAQQLHVRYVAGGGPTAEQQQGSDQQQQQQPGSSHDDQGMRMQLLQRALGHVKQQGWTHAALVAAARDLQLSPAVTGILPRREGELVEHVIRACNTRLADELAERADELAALPATRDRLALALRLRLEMLQPHIGSWAQALSVASRPGNLPHSLQLLASLVDDVWHAAGASATDSSWYSQRVLLAGVYTCTELYMLTDCSPGFQETWQALDRRLSDMLALSRASEDVVNKAAREAEGMTGSMTDAFATLRAAAAGGAPPPPRPAQPQQQQQQQQQTESSESSAQGGGDVPSEQLQRATASRQG